MQENQFLGATGDVANFFDNLLITFNNDFRLLARYDVQAVQMMLEEASSSADCKDVRQDPWPILMYTHMPRRVQSSRTARLDALAIAVGCDSRRDKATDPETNVTIHVSYDSALIDRMQRRDSSQALERKS